MLVSKPSDTRMCPASVLRPHAAVGFVDPPGDDVYLPPTMTLRVSRARLTQLMDQARAKRVAVVGDAMLDAYLTGDVDRVSPEAPVAVVRVRERRHALGGAANVAQNVMAIGCQCDLVAALGSDRGGEVMREMIDATGIGTDSLLTVGRPTTQKTRIVARSQQLLRVDEEDDSDLTGEEAEAVIELDHVFLAFDTPILEDVSFVARKGETICIVGESGTGKSTTLKLILRLLVPEKGAVCIGGKNITELNFEEALEVRQTMGMVFQGAALFDSMSVFENIPTPCASTPS